MITYRKKWIDTNEAMGIVGRAGLPVTRPSLISWIRQYENLGKKVGGRWYVDRLELGKFLEGRGERKSG